MKRFLLSIVFFLLMILSMPALADILPLSTKSIKHYGIGVLNMPATYTVYKYPYKEAKVLKEVSYEKMNRSAIVNTVDMRKVSYVAYVPSENIAMLTVDLNLGNDWYCVYINQSTGEKGWVYNPKRDAFYTYRRLFYKYGKPYGVRFFADLSDDEKVLYSKEDTSSKVIEQVKYPKHVSFTVIRGNWMLATVSDLDKVAKVGWFNWRNEDGTLNMFPNFQEK